MAVIDDLRRRISKATLENVDSIILEVHQYCSERKGRGSAKTLLEEELHPSVYENLTGKQLMLLENGPTESPKPLNYKKLLAESEDLQLQIAQEILDPVYVYVEDEGGNTSYCKIKDIELKILHKFPNHQEAIGSINKTLTTGLTDNYSTLPTGLVQEMQKQWIAHKPVPIRPKAMLRPDEEGWCFHRSLLKIEAGPIPYWQKVLDRLSDPEAFAAWIWGVYSGEYKGRQMLWMHGPHGEDGKSSIARVIGEVFGGACESISNAQFSGSEKRFLNSSFVHSRLVIYPDANNTHALLSEAFKTVASAGADKVPIEFKGRTAYSGYLNARLWIASNYGPHVTKDNFLRSRLLYSYISKMGESPDANAPVKIIEELPHFFHYAKLCYAERCPDNYAIQVNELTKNLVEELYIDSHEEFTEIFASNFEKTYKPSDRVTGSEMQSILRSAGLSDNRKQKEFHQWLEKVHNITKERVPTINTKVFKGLKIGKTVEPAEENVFAGLV
jgi:hypothetical protein